MASYIKLTPGLCSDTTYLSRYLDFKWTKEIAGVKGGQVIYVLSTHLSTSTCMIHVIYCPSLRVFCRYLQVPSANYSVANNRACIVDPVVWLEKLLRSVFWITYIVPGLRRGSKLHTSSVVV